MIKIETGFGDGEKIISSEVKYILTAKELEQLQREAFESGRKRGQYEIVGLRMLCSYSYEDSVVGLPDFNDYLSSKNKEEAE